MGLFAKITGCLPIGPEMRREKDWRLWTGGDTLELSKKTSTRMDYRDRTDCI